MPVDEVCRLINAIDNHRTEFSAPPFISKKLRELVKVPEPINEKKSMDELQQKIENKNEQTNEQTIDKLKQIKDELKEQLRDEFKQQMRDEFKQQNEQIRDELKQTKNELMKDMQELLNSFVKNSNSNNNVKDKIDE